MEQERAQGQEGEHERRDDPAREVGPVAQGALAAAGQLQVDRELAQAPEVTAEEPALKPRTPKDAAADAKKVLAYIKTEAQGRAAIPKKISTSSKLYTRLHDHYLQDYLADPNPTTGKAATAKIGEQLDPATADQTDYWERNAAEWNEQPISAGLRQLRPEFPEKMGAGTGVLGAENRQHLAYLDVPQLVGSDNTDFSEDADVLKGGKNISQLMHWASGVRAAGMDQARIRELFLAYELFHLEGWDVFAEDPVNDLIAEDAGHILGQQLERGEINKGNLEEKLNEGFGEARAWVGTLLLGRQADFDKWILLKEARPALEWWNAEQKWEVWGTETIYSMLLAGHPLEDVEKWSMTQHIIDIYSLIYETKIWQSQHGKIRNSNFIENMLVGDYDAIFEAAVKGKELTKAQMIRAKWNAGR